jgi:cytoskeletal protein RodZ
MAESLGEKLRLAREARGITLSEVSAQTRIATRYLEAIEENNYKPLPGGVFNKGFIKAYAKYVGVDEQEALNDYARLLATQTESDDDGDRYRRPMVLTDDRNRSSASSLIFAVIILLLMTGGILLLVRWYNSPPSEQAKTPARQNPANSNANVSNAANTSEQTPPAVEQLKVELKSVAQTGTAITAWVDEAKETGNVTPASPKTYNPQNSFRISYSRYHAENLQLLLNGKLIQLPMKPLNPTDSLIKFEINKDNAAQIMQSGEIRLGDTGPTVVPGADANINTNAAPVAALTPKPTPKAAPSPPVKTPTPGAANSGVTIMIPPVKTPTPKTTPKPKAAATSKPD